VRTSICVGAALFLAAIVLPALAQQPAGQPSANQFFTGVNPRTISMPKVDPTKAMRNTNITKALQPNSAQKSTGVFNLSNVFPKVTLGSWPPKLPTFVAVKTPSVPTSTTVPQGVNLFPTGK
jgi:hypothetical protein